jgi:hypothetical protein
MKCCICGTVKNCGSYLDRIFLNMESAGMLFETYIILLYYDHSNDNTLIKLKQYKEKYPTRLDYFINNEKLSAYRTQNIAKGRNLCLNRIREKYSDYEYFIMMDCDDVCSGILKRNVLLHYLLRNDWDGLSFHHPNGYYDIWALSIDPLYLSYNHFLDGSKLYMNYISNVIQKTPKHALIPCFSAFNGFSIYRTKKFMNCSYDGLYDSSYISEDHKKKTIFYAGNILNKALKEDCEHRKFHFQAIQENNARLRISPNCLFAKLNNIHKNLNFF